ncbi:hypothetical protein PENSTE_c011G03376 [Penicillium steckii]|uniref:2EXR domain-containing protein n=1 Tax=Penicillium steckii TaxID=303698 RepID=A0A1V6T5X8_9EURO|nr:hypothetical protein PENSTE_c011G03376 [Penicillium steckii]
MSDQNNINMSPNPHHEEQPQRQPTQEEIDALWKQARTQPDALVHQGSGLPEGSIKLSMMDINKSLMSVIDDERTLRKPAPNDDTARRWETASKTVGVWLVQSLEDAMKVILRITEILLSVPTGQSFNLCKNTHHIIYEGKTEVPQAYHESYDRPFDQEVAAEEASSSANRERVPANGGAGSRTTLVQGGFKSVKMSPRSSLTTTKMVQKVPRNRTDHPPTGDIKLKPLPKLKDADGFSEWKISVDKNLSNLIRSDIPRPKPTPEQQYTSQIPIESPTTLFELHNCWCIMSDQPSSLLQKSTSIIHSRIIEQSHNQLTCSSLAAQLTCSSLEMETQAPTFHLFPLLPTEIRLIIWKHSLPHRVIEYDSPWDLLYGLNIRLACNSLSTAEMNSRMPSLASVNQESRYVVLRSGRWHQRDPDDDDLNEDDEQSTMEEDELSSTEEDKTKEETGLPRPRSFWVQPVHDTLHLNWVRDSLDLEINAVSFTAATFHRPTIEKLTLNQQYPSIPGPEIPLNDQCEQEIRSLAEATWLERPSETLSVTVLAISIHVTRQATLYSGLFGTCGDEPIQLVAFQDSRLLEKFETLYESHTDERFKHPEIKTAFDLLKCGRNLRWMDSWRQEMEWVFLRQFWRIA